jgi:hypothetical protein
MEERKGGSYVSSESTSNALAGHDPTVDLIIKYLFKHFLVGCDCICKAGHVNGERFFYYCQ